MFRAQFVRRGAALAVVAITASLLVAVGVLTPSLQDSAVAAPGTPGTPSAPIQLYLENFENGTGVQEIESYVGASGATYGADSYWLRAMRCNGFILAYGNVAQPTGYCNNLSGNWVAVRAMANALGYLSSPETPTTNRAVSSNSSGFAENNLFSQDGTVVPNNQREFATNANLSLPVSNRFVTFSVDAAAQACGLAQPLLRFYLKDANNIEQAVSSSAINPCTSPQGTTRTIDGVTVRSGTFAANGSMLMTGTTFGIVMRNEQAQTNGNDHAFDNIRVLDVTPQLDKSFAPTSVPVGGVSTLTLTVTNTSELAAKSGWAFTDDLPAGLVVAPTPNLGGSCVANRATSAGSSTIAITNGVLAVGQTSCTITVDVTSASPTPSQPSPTTYQNCAANISNVVGMNLPQCATVEFFSEPELTIEKTSTATADSRPGDVVEYTVTATNTGNRDYTASNPAVVFDDLSGVLDDATFNDDAEASIGAEPSFASPLLSWSGALVAGDSVSLTYSVTVGSAGDGALRNVSWIPDDPADPVPPACDAPVDGSDPVSGEPCATTIQPLPRLSVEKSADQATLPAVGDQVIYTIVVTNDGPGDYTSTAPASAGDDLSDVLDDATFDDGSLTATVGTVDRSGSTISWSGPLAAGETVTITYSVTYTADGDTALTNRACVPEDLAAAGAAPCASVTTLGAGLRQSKTADPSSSPLVAGSTITYTLSFENDGQAPASLDAVDDLTHVLDDADVTVEPTSADGLTIVRDGERIGITGSIPAGALYTVRYTVTVRADADRGDSIASNFLLAPGETPPADPECDPADPDLPDCTRNPISGVTYTKAVDASESPVTVGTELTYTITVVNTGATEVDVDRDDDLTDVLDDATLNAAPESDTASVTVDGPTDDILALRGTLPAGQTAQVRYTVTVKPAADRGDSRASNYLVAPGATPAETCDPATAQCTGTPIQGYSASKAADVENAAPGDVVTYTVTVTNTGSVDLADAAAATFTDDLSEVLDDATYNGDVSAGGTVSGDQLTWAGPLDGGDSVAITYSVTVNDPRTGDGVLRNAVVPTSPGGACDADDGCRVETPVSSFTVAKSADARTALPGEIISYTITVTNTGQVDYTDAEPASFSDDLSDVLDDAVYNDDASAGAMVGGSTLEWSGALLAGESVEITYSVTVDDPITGDFVLRNVVTANGAGGSCGDECRTETPVGSFRVVKSADSTAVTPGDTVVYTVTVTNTGQVAYTDALPAVFSDDMSDVLDDATYNGDAAGSGGGSITFEAPRLTWTGPLAIGETATITYSVTVNDPATGDQSLVNLVETPAGAGGNCAPGATDPACIVDVLSGSFTVEKEASAGTALPGDVIGYTITVTNTGDVAYTADEPASFTDDLSRVLDDAAYNGDVGLGGSVSGTTLSWSGPLAVGEVVTVTYSVTVDASVTGDFALRNVVMPSTPGGECGEIGCVTDTPIGSYRVVKDSDADSVVLGGVVTYSITVTNTGEVAYLAGDPASFSDDLSAVLDDATYNGDASNGATLSGSTLTWSGALDIGASITVTYSVTVDQPATGDLILRNTVDPDGRGGACADDDDCVAETRIATYAVSKTVSSDRAVVGDRLTYTITVTNTGRVAYTDDAPASFTDDLTPAPAIASYDDDATNGAVYDRPTLSWQGALDVGETIVVTYSVTLREVGQLRNVVVTPDGSGASCPDDAPAPECIASTTVLPPGLAITGGAAWIGGGLVGALLLAFGLWFVARRRQENAVDPIDL